MNHKSLRKAFQYFFTTFITILLFLPLDIITYGNIVTSDFKNYFIFNIPFVLILIFLYAIAVKISNRVIDNNKIFLKILIESVYAILIMYILLFLSRYLSGTVPHLGYFIRETFQENEFYISTVEAIFLILFIELSYSNNKRREDELEKEKFKYNQLMSKLDPHFLFNCFNVLSSMVYNNKPSETNDYIEKLSDIYRYILNNQEKVWVLLKEEEKFIINYAKVMNVRFSEGFVFNIDLKEENLNKQVLMMSLQLLVENAVKHNIVSKEEPLIVSIYSEKDYIVVKNNINRRRNKVISTGIGLVNLNERYKLMTKKGIKIIEENNIFIVKIPMI